MSPMAHWLQQRIICVPRASGDEPVPFSQGVFALVVFPARAGMSPMGITASPNALSVPRASGDEPTATPPYYQP